MGCAHAQDGAAVARDSSGSQQSQGVTPKAGLPCCSCRFYSHRTPKLVDDKAPSPAQAGPAPRPPENRTGSPQKEEERWQEELTSSPLVLGVVLPAARPLPGGSQTLLPAASTRAGEKQRAEVCEGLHFLNCVRRMGQRKGA